jgi:hypothetical protein
LELEFELELLLELLLELELELELEFELELLLWLELELLLWFELELLLWFELELLLWLEPELLLWLELELLFWLERLVGRLEEVRLRRLIVPRFRLIVRRFATARARHHSIGFPSIFRSTGTAARAAVSEIGVTVALPPSDRDDGESRAAPIAMPRAPSAPA